MLKDCNIITLGLKTYEIKPPPTASMHPVTNFSRFKTTSSGLYQVTGATWYKLNLKVGQRRWHHIRLTIKNDILFYFSSDISFVVAFFIVRPAGTALWWVAALLILYRLLYPPQINLTCVFLSVSTALHVRIYMGRAVLLRPRVLRWGDVGRKTRGSWIAESSVKADVEDLLEGSSCTCHVFLESLLPNSWSIHWLWWDGPRQRRSRGDPRHKTIGVHNA